MHSHSRQQELISQLFEQWSGESPADISALPPSGSDRKYFRIQYSKGSVIGAYNPIEEENTAFLTFTKHFRSKGLPVPEVLAEDTSNFVYLLEDLGDTTLFSLLPHQREPVCFGQEVMGYYKKILDRLPHFQIGAAKDMDFSVCFPRHAFDRNSMMWDLNYFKYYFLKLAGIIYDEQKLEDDFQAFCDYLLEADDQYFLYRDFQSRNIMIRGGEPWFIDYQGGRKGALQYDIASLLFDAKANLHPRQREELLNYYIGSLKNHIPVKEETFKDHFYGFVLIRIMQAMGAYGFRGFYEKKPLFLQSIPYAKRNMLWLLENDKIPATTPYLKQIVEKIIKSPRLKQYDKPSTGLKVSIRSFSYKKGFPVDESGNGGGFVFDCRSLPNPGREPAYKMLTGKDADVIEYLENEPAVGEYIDTTSRIVERSVDAYLERGFTHLMVCYGCTGGQHRSVYSAERLAEQLAQKFDVTIDLQHVEELSWP
ncbi:MAG: phosphotransferase enzyme family protein [Bacteroidetes bacterium]|nr:MAG: phosphotransferase enzyme family protein [Bacteroidota bacterium]